MNIIHSMHEQCACEHVEMTLDDGASLHSVAVRIAGPPVVTDSLLSIRHPKVRVLREDSALATESRTERAFPCGGNKDHRVDQLAVSVVTTFMNTLRKYWPFRDAADGRAFHGGGRRA